MRKIFKKKQGSVIENMLVALMGMVMITAFLVIMFGAFSSISNKWQMRQTAREYMLLMETEGYLKPSDEVNLIHNLNNLGLYNVSLAGTTRNEVGYGGRIDLVITGTYDENILAFAGGISKVTSNPVEVVITKQSTAKQ